MAKLLLTIACFALLHSQVRPQFLNLPIDVKNLISQVQPGYPIVESPYNTVVPAPPNVAPSSTTIITDCSPSTCKNLANTLQLMIVCNLLQNSNGGSDLALQLAAPMISELFTSPTLSCGCANPFAASPLIPPNVVSPSVVTPNIYPNVIPPNLIAGLLNSVGPGILNLL